MKKGKTHYEVFIGDPENRRLLNQEELIYNITEKLWVYMEENNISRQELAQRLSKSKGFVTQILSGGRNLTLRTLADVALSLGFKIDFQFEKLVRDEHLGREDEYKSMVVPITKKKPKSNYSKIQDSL